MNVGDIIEGVDGGAYLIAAHEDDVWQAVALEPWHLTEGYEFEVEGLAGNNTYRIVPDDGGEYGCRALRVD